MNKGEVQKGYHCVWQINYHIVFLLKYRKALLDKRELVKIGKLYTKTRQTEEIFETVKDVLIFDTLRLAAGPLTSRRNP